MLYRFAVVQWNYFMCLPEDIASLPFLARRATLIPVPARSLNRDCCTSARHWNWCNSMTHTNKHTVSCALSNEVCLYNTPQPQWYFCTRARGNKHHWVSVLCADMPTILPESTDSRCACVTGTGHFSGQIWDYCKCAPVVGGWLVQSCVPNLI